MISKKFLILTEAGKGIGFGHLTRCTALRNELVKQGHLVDFIVYLKDFKIENPDFTESDWLSLPPEEMVKSSEAVIIDSYLVTKEWLRDAAESNSLLVQFDDYNRIEYPVDLIINPNVFADEIDYSNQTAKYIGGPEFVIIRAPFRNMSEEIRETNSPRLFITMGGSDYRNMLPKLAKWALDHKTYHIRLVAPEGTNISLPRIDVLPLLSAEEMAEEMKRADVVISACGQTLHELAALKKPTIGICLDKDQVPNHKFYNGVGFIRGNLFWNQDDLKQQVESELTRLLNTDERKKAACSFEGINPNGVGNIAETILNSL